jgi:streptogramin lyase
MKTWRVPRRSYAAGCLIVSSLAFAISGDSAGQVVTEFPIPGPTAALPTRITAGSDGNLWFGELNRNKIGRITTDGVITEFTITGASGINDIVSGPDGKLWFVDAFSSQVGRITTAGVFDLYSPPTAGAYPVAITAGPDGNLWFTEFGTNKIARMTTNGSITEFPIPTDSAEPSDIAAGPDGALWFSETGPGQIGRITTDGDVTEFPLTDQPQAIALGPDGNLWITPSALLKQITRFVPGGAQTPFPTLGVVVSVAAGPDSAVWYGTLDSIGRIRSDGSDAEFPTLTADANVQGITLGPDGAMWFTEYDANNIGRITVPTLSGLPMAVDEHNVTGSSSNVNGVFEPGETVEVAPAWHNGDIDAQPLSGQASNLHDSNNLYTIDDDTADYGTIAVGADADCAASTGDCYLMTVAPPGGIRPSGHWDVKFTETLTPASRGSKAWTLHMGESFPDVPTTNLFYRFVENLFHNGVTGGCGGGNYCPGNPVTRAQMAVFLLKGKHGSAYVAPACSSTVFADEPCPGGQFVDWVNQLSSEGITGGCGAGNYCPTNPVLRKQMAVFLLKAEHGSSYMPPVCGGDFADVPCPSQFADWIEQLAAEGITGGCGNGNYCPDNPNTRGQMAVFLVKTFGLSLYGP